MGWVSEGELEEIKAKAQKNSQSWANKPNKADFDQTTFQAYVVGASIKPGGDLELKLGVPPEYKWDALKLSDAAGLMLVFEVRRD